MTIVGKDSFLRRGFTWAYFKSETNTPEFRETFIILVIVTISVKMNNWKFIITTIIITCMGEETWIWVIKSLKCQENEWRIVSGHRNRRLSVESPIYTVPALPRIVSVGGYLVPLKVRFNFTSEFFSEMAEKLRCVCDLLHKLLNSHDVLSH